MTYSFNYESFFLKSCHPVLKRYLEREIRIRTDILKSIERKILRRYQVRKRQLEEELNIAEKDGILCFVKRSFK